MYLIIASFNNLKLTNTFLRKKDIYKYILASRGYRSIIDYIIVNNKIACQVKDTRVYRGYDIGSDHYLVILQIDTYAKRKKK